MRKRIILFLLVVSVLSMARQEKMYIHKSDKITLGAPISNVDSLKFNSDGSIAILSVSGSFSEYPVVNIDSISFGANSNDVSIVYSGSTVNVINPYAFEGITVSVNGADVVVQSTTETRDINYILSGTSTNGMFKIYSDKRFNLLLSGVQLTNTDGPAINIQADKKATVTLVDGTVNTLADGATYATAPLDNLGVAEDQKAVFFSEGQLLFNGSGSLSITGMGTEQHGLCSDEYIYFESGTIAINSAVKDGIHGKDGVYVVGGTLNVASTGDGIDGNDGVILISGGNITTVNSAADVSGIVCDSTITVTGGTINVTANGAQSKGISADYAISLSGGDITVKTTGGVVLTASGSGYDPSYSTAIKSNILVEVNGAKVIINTSGAGSKGIVSDGNVKIISGIVNITSAGAGTTFVNTSGVTDTYFSSSITSDKDINILGGTITIQNSGTAGKGITADGNIIVGDVIQSPIINITTTGGRILLSGSGMNANYSIAKALKGETSLTIDNGTIVLIASGLGAEGMESFALVINGGDISITANDDSVSVSKGGETMSGSDGSSLIINGGYLYVNSSVGDGIDSNGTIEMTGGTVVDHGPTSAPEEGVDFNGTFKMTGGLFISSGSNSNMNQPMSTISTQRNIYVLSAAQIATNTIFRIQDASGNDVLTFKPIRAFYSIVFSSSVLKVGVSYSIYTGGTCTGTIKNGLYTGGTYTGGTLKKTITLSATSTVNSVTF